MFARIFRFFSVSIALSLVLAGTLETARPASAAEGILTIGGGSPSVAEVDLDYEALARMPHHRVVTSTPWTEGASVFEGVLMRELMRVIGVTGTTIKLVALNDYSITIPVSDIESYDVILAYERDGAPMPVRDKGPLWVIYPLDAHPELNAQETHAKMIWQVRRMEVM